MGGKETVEVYVVEERDSGDWVPVAVYESFDDAKDLEPDGDWRTDDEWRITENWRGTRELMIHPVPFYSRKARP